MDLQLLAEETAEAPAEAAPTPDEAFEGLIAGDYRAQYEAKTAALREQAARYDEAAPLLKHIAERVGMPDADAGQLLQTLEGREKAREEKAKQAEEGLHARAEALQAKWDAQAEQARTLFPHLELTQELRDPRFQALLCADVDVATAYQAVHLQELLPAAMAYTAKAVEQKLAASSGGTRPGENGASGAAAAAVRLDPAHMDARSFRSLCRRVESGEKIRLG